jgi:hypothetical protein
METNSNKVYNTISVISIAVLITILIYLLLNNRSYSKEIKTLDKERIELADSIEICNIKINELQIKADSIDAIPEFVDSIKYIKNEVTERYQEESDYFNNVSDDSLFLFFTRELSKKSILK